MAKRLDEMSFDNHQPTPIDYPADFDIRKLGRKMPRSRHQNGWIESSRGKWIGHWHIYVRLENGNEIRRNRERVLGDRQSMTKHAARIELAKLIANDPGTESAKPDQRVTLRWFYEHRFKPLAEANWKESTRKSFPYLIERHILARFGEQKLCDLQVFEIQKHVNELSVSHKAELGATADMSATSDFPNLRASSRRRVRRGRQGAESLQSASLPISNELSSGGVEGHAGHDSPTSVREGDGSLSQVGQGHRGNANSRYQARPAGYSKSTILHVKKLFVQILEKAVELEYLPRNPAARLTVPKNLKKGSERILTMAEIEILDRGLLGRERLIFRMLVLLGLRPGELFARRWEDWQGDKLVVNDAVYRGKIDAPKTEHSKAFVWLPELLQLDLLRHRGASGQYGFSDFIFKSCHGTQGRPLDTHNYLRRIFKPLCAALGVSEVTHQCLRRTCATYLQRHGSVKDAQAHMRHSSAKTTLDVYMKDIPASVKQAVEEMSRELFPESEGKERVN